MDENSNSLDNEDGSKQPREGRWVVVKKKVSLVLVEIWK